MSDTSRPSLSVVVAVHEVPDTLEEALTALEAQEDLSMVEVILSDGSPSGLEPALRQRFPWLRFLRPTGTTLPVLKGEAIRAARGELVAILDPYDAPEPGWVRAILEGMGPDGPAADAEAMGGVVLAAGWPTAGNLGGYLFEYGAFNPPVVSGPTDGDLPGNNVVYRRSVLVERCADVLAEEGFNKPFFHARIRGEGGTLVIHPGMRVRHLTHHRFSAFAVRRFHYGRCFGATRRRRSGGARGLLYVAFAPTVPFLLMWRHGRRALAHPGNRRLLPRGGLALMGVCLFWGVGEWLGTWFGPGPSCRFFY